MARPERYFVGPNMRDQLRDVVTRVAGTPIGGGGAEIPTRLQDLPRPSGGGGGGVVEAYFVNGWVKGANKQIRFLANTATTAMAVNLIRSVPQSTGQTSRVCTVTLRSAGTPDYVLLNTEC